MRPLAVMLSLALTGSLPRTAMGSGVDDVDLIPSNVLGEAAAQKPAAADPKEPEVRRTFQGRFFVEDALTLSSAPGAVPVPYPSGLVVDWQNRSSLDASFRWKPWTALAITVSDRVNVFEQNGVAFDSTQTLRNDVREGFVTWEPVSNTFFEGGRINVRNGSALGFNPTDFFKTRTLVGQASLDPSVLRQNRLGTLLGRGQTIWSGGSASIAFAPKVATPSPIDETNPPLLDPRFDATNAATRVLCAVNLDMADLSPQLLGYFELHRSKLGLNLTRPVGDAVVAYAEWAGGLEANLITRAVAYGQATGTLPAGAAALPPTDTSSVVRNDLAAGFSWTIATRVTLNLEYHFHQSGFTHGNWQQWFALGSKPGAPPAIAGELWYVRGYANDQQEPVPMHQGFVRASWPQAFVKELELSSFALVDLLDASVITQLSASYYLSDAWTMSAFGSANLGEAHTERGSFPQRVSGIVQLTRYL
jgi:hypothetical protein